MTTEAASWTGSLHQTFRLLPASDQSRNLRPFLEAHGRSPEEILATLPYDWARARGGNEANLPDAKRYRDGRHVYQTAGLLYEDDGAVHVTDLGRAVLRWLPIITPSNCVVLGKHAAYALAACQLRNPTGAGSKFADDVEVFPFQFIWRAMLELDGQLSSDELNRAVLKTMRADDLEPAIESIRRARRSNDPTLMGAEVITGRSKNDRLIPWMSLASFGWTLFPDKRAGEGEHYEIPPATRRLLREASRIRYLHRDFSSVKQYVEHVSDRAALPKDVR